MYGKRLLRFIVTHSKNIGVTNYNRKTTVPNRSIHRSSIRKYENNSKTDDRKMTIREGFENIQNENKNTYLDMIRMFTNRDVHRRGHVEFIYSALKTMEEFGLQKDIGVYKALIDVLPKGKFIPQNNIQAEFMHYPKQQQCAIDLLEQMEDNGVMPDAEVEQMLLNVFGKRGHPLKKCWRMMYWMPKFKNLSPWPVPNPPPNDSFELAQLAIARICSVDVQSKVTIYQTTEIPDAIEDTWIVSGQSPIQKKLLRKHKRDEPIYVEGSYRIWLRNKAVNYFVLRANTKVTLKEGDDPDDVSKINISVFDFALPKNASIMNLISVHEQEDGVVLATCATGTSSKDTLLSWIRHLEKDGNSILGDVSIVFTLKTAEKEISFSTLGEKKNEIEDC